MLNVRLVFIWAVLIFGFTVANAQATPDSPKVKPQKDAASLFAAGIKAQEAGRFKEAATYFERAHVLAPSVAALRSAIRNRVGSGEIARAGVLVERLRSICIEPVCLKLGKAVSERLSATHFRVLLSCSPSCLVDEYDQDLKDLHVLYLPSGQHIVHVTFEGGVSTHTKLVGSVGENVTTTVTQPRPLEELVEPKNEQLVNFDAVAGVVVEEKDSRRFRLHPSIGIAGLALAAGLAGATVWSVDDTHKFNSRFRQDPSVELQSDGDSRDVRSNIFLWSGIGVAVVSVATLVFWTDWDSDRPKVK